MISVWKWQNLSIKLEFSANQNSFELKQLIGLFILPNMHYKILKEKFPSSTNIEPKKFHHIKTERNTILQKNKIVEILLDKTNSILKENKKYNSFCKFECFISICLQ